MRPHPIALALLALALGAMMAPTETRAQRTYTYDVPAYRGPDIAEQPSLRAERRAMRAERRAARQERREMRALRLDDPEATTADLNASQLRKLDRQDRAEQRAEIRREQRMMRRQLEMGY